MVEKEDLNALGEHIKGHMDLKFKTVGIQFTNITESMKTSQDNIRALFTKANQNALGIAKNTGKIEVVDEKVGSTRKFFAILVGLIATAVAVIAIFS